jgi:hypothetical protein
VSKSDSQIIRTWLDYATTAAYMYLLRQESVGGQDTINELASHLWPALMLTFQNTRLGTDSTSHSTLGPLIILPGSFHVNFKAQPTALLSGGISNSRVLQATRCRRLSPRPIRWEHWTQISERSRSGLPFVMTSFRSC